MTRRLPCFALLVVLAMAGSSCGDGVKPEEARTALVSSLMEGVNFPNAMLLTGDFPDPQGPDAVLLPLGGNVVLQPAGGGVLALQVEDEENRPISATLIQFRDASSPREGGGQYLRVPVDEDLQASDIVENPFNVDAGICEEVCAGLFVLDLVQAIEFSSGDVTSTKRRQVVVDCTEEGDPALCDEAGGGSGGATLVEGDLLCGALGDEDEPLYTGEPLLDLHFDAVVQLSSASTKAADELDDAVEAIGEVFGVDDADFETASAAALTAVEENTEDGLSLQIGELGCGIRAREVRGALARCDLQTFIEFAGLECMGDCRMSKLDDGCDGGVTTCKGVAEDLICDDQCVGACIVALDTPGPCVGTCNGTCTGACPDDGSGGCLGPCEGDCGGECRGVSPGQCDGLCTGLCDGTDEGGEACPSTTQRYCVSDEGETVQCEGACFGEVVLDPSQECGVAPLSLGKIYPLCEPTLVQVSFAFAENLDPAAQMSFAALADDLNEPLRELYESLAKIDLLGQAAGELSGDAMDIVGEAVDAINGPESKMRCAMDRLEDAVDSIDMEMSKLSEKQSEAMSVVSALEAMP